ncbi:MAG TPA: holo-ACP synthase [Candidatus Nanopelagicales bacterium]
MPVTVGIDLVHVPRMERLLRSQRTRERVFTPAEQLLCAEQAQRFAGRWAAKEAVMKALGQGIGELAPTEIEVLAGPSGAPALCLHGAAATTAADQGWETWQVSISHDGEYATAIAIGTASG